MRRLTLAVLALVSACSTSSPAGATKIALSGHDASVATPSYAAWPQASHDARRSGGSPSTGPQTAHLRWTRHLEGDVTPGPVIGPGGTIYAASNAGTLHALDPATGEDVWVFKPRNGYGSDLSTSAAVLKNGTVLWPGPGGLYALSPKGKQLWSLDLGGQATSPAIDGSRVVVATTSGVVASLDVAKGTTVWKVDVGGSGFSSVALSPTDQHRAYVTANDELVALDDAKVAWRAKLGKLSEVSPAVAPDGTIVVGSNAPYERGFSPAGREIWKFNRHSETYSSPVVTDDGIAYFGDHHAVLSAVDVRSGKLLARYPGPTTRPQGGRSVGIWTSPVIDNRHDVYWGSRSGHIHAVDASGKTLFDLDTRATVDSYPALTDGLLVVGVTDGRLLGIGA